MRGGDEAHVDRDRRGLADRDDLALLQDAQQRALRREREVPDLVEEQRAAFAVRIAPGRSSIAPVYAPRR